MPKYCYTSPSSRCVYNEHPCLKTTGLLIFYLYLWSEVAQSCLTLCDPMDSSVHGIFQAIVLECHFLLQGIFPTQGSNPGLLRYRQALYRLVCFIFISSYSVLPFHLVYVFQFLYLFLLLLFFLKILSSIVEKLLYTHTHECIVYIM